MSRTALAFSCRNGGVVSNVAARIGTENGLLVNTSAFRSNETEKDIAVSFTFAWSNHKVARSMKRNQAGVGGKPDNSACPTPADGVITALDEITKHQWLSFLVGSHQMRIGR